MAGADIHDRRSDRRSDADGAEIFLGGGSDGDEVLQGNDSRKDALDENVTVER